MRSGAGFEVKRRQFEPNRNEIKFKRNIRNGNLELELPLVMAQLAPPLEFVFGQRLVDEALVEALEALAPGIQEPLRLDPRLFQALDLLQEAPLLLLPQVHLWKQSIESVN